MFFGLKKKDIIRVLEGIGRNLFSKGSIFIIIIELVFYI